MGIAAPSRSDPVPSISSMRAALVSPYSWTYPGGVTRHIEALAGELVAGGHEIRVYAPFDRDTRATALMHRGARPQVRERPEWLVPLGGTIGWPLNGAVSNLAGTPSTISTLRRELRAFAPDVVHLHEPVAPVVGWDALTSADAPLVATFHCYSEAVPPHLIAALLGSRRKLNHLTLRLAVSEAAAWTGRRFHGGHYRIVPNGVTLPAGGVPAPRRRMPGEPLRIVFVGQAVERKGLPVLVRAFEALRGQVPAELTIVGATHDEIAPLLMDAAGVTALGRIDDDARHAALVDADVLCAPSLGGESFGMVLTEAFAAGRGVVASDIAGYRDVVADGADGLLVPRGDATKLAETLRDLALEPERTTRLGAEAARSAERYAWPRVAEQVVAAYEDAREVPAPEGRRRARRRQDRCAAGRRAPTLARAPPALARAGAARAARAADRAPRRDGRFDRRRRCRRAAGARPDRHAADRPRSGRLAARVGAGRAGADVRLDARARRRLARDPARRAARRAAAARGLDPGDHDRRSDVGDAARAPRRALARADRRPSSRPPARAAARRARHDRLADAAERARARDPGRGDVHHDRAVRRPPAGAGVVRAGAVRRAVRGAGRARAAALGPAVALGASAPLGRAGARRARARAVRLGRVPVAAAGRRGDRDAARRLGAAAGQLLRAARRARTSISTSAPPPRSCSRST